MTAVAVSTVEQLRVNAPQSQRLWRKAQQVLAGGVGHDLRYAPPHPLYIARAQGAYKWDVDGHKYVDYSLGNGAMLLGHAHPVVVNVIQEAAALGSHFGNDHPLHIEWAEWVQRLVPCAERVRFVNSGTEATHLAIRVARAATGRSKLLRFAGHFHGWHDDVVHGYVPPFDRPVSRGVPASVEQQTICINDGDADLLAQTLGSNGDIAAVIVEASGASWGRVPLDAAYLRALRDLTAQHNVVLIFDEVVSGFRWAPGGTQETSGVTPDLACFAKVVAGGMPGGAVAGSAQLMQGFDFAGEPEHDRYERVVHGGTFNASPCSAAAGIAALRLIATAEPIEQANRLAADLRQRLDGVLERQRVAGYVYGPASTFHAYFETDPQRITAERGDLFTADALRIKSIPSRVVSEYQRRLRLGGVDLMSYTGGVLSSAHTEADLAQTEAVFEQAISRLLADGFLLTLA